VFGAITESNYPLAARRSEAEIQVSDDAIGFLIPRRSDKQKATTGKEVA